MHRVEGIEAEARTIATDGPESVGTLEWDSTTIVLVRVHADGAYGIGYKAEFLSHHYKRRLRPRAAYSMGLIMLHARVPARAPRLANAVAKLGVVKRAAGIAPQRPMPAFAREPFRSWWSRRGAVKPAGAAGGAVR